MIPRPPICISAIISVFPLVVKANWVSTTDKPVTQTALVEVKRASVKEIPEVVELGIIRSKAPKKITNAKLRINN